MNIKPTTGIALLATVFGLGLASGLVAQTSGDSPNRTEQKRTELSGASHMEVISSFVEIKPGESSNLHIHHGVEAFYVVQGAMIQVGDKAPSKLATGFTSQNLRDVKHGGFKVLGDTPLKLFTVHIVDKGKPLYDVSQ